ncbi:MAG: acyl-CoA synthetase [Alphaproteobacteria bacterium]|nr:acyl-CoA synthetase [Alphaproteobacteria bacterium]
MSEGPVEPVLCHSHVGNGLAELTLFIPPDLAQCEGHFPGQPVLPGVVQVDWAVLLAARHLGLAIESAQKLQVKFRRVTVPGMTVVLRLQHVPARRRLTFEYRCEDDILSSGSIALPQS